MLRALLLLITYFYQGSFKFEQILYIVIYLGQSVLIYLFISLLQKRAISRHQIRLLWCFYIVIMLILLFGRSYFGISVNLNPLKLFEMDSYTFFQNLFNFILFMPIGMLFKTSDSNKHVLLLSLISVLSIETIQLVSRRGIFDIVDILFDMIGIYVGFLLSQHISSKYKIEIL
ncbi:VanZ family protein [Lactimicrobium sp.]|jgi:glycopeptide antibiotics resistance protein|uniref:VanZ family protein n=1 Tax=Lactimicrobium sp. TaxID=2563780 RepID=UPI003FA56B40